MIENIPVRIARPLTDENNLPVIVYFHGGAFYMCSLGKLDSEKKDFCVFECNCRYTQ